MATTANYGWNKPGATDTSGVRTDLNAIHDAIDTSLKTVADTEAAARAAADAAAMPWTHLILPLGGFINITGTGVRQPLNTVVFGGYTYTVNQNDEIGWDIPMAAGTWAIDITRNKNDSYGITSVMLDGVSWTTFDNYNAAAQVNQVSQATGLTVATSGNHRVSLKAATKNASSSGYVQATASLFLRRTA